MAGSGPTILVVDSDREERGVIAATLCEAGFVVVAAAHDRAAGAAMIRQHFAAAIIALPDGGVAFLRRARRRQPGLAALLVIDPAALRSIDADVAAVVTRPIDPRQLLGRAFELVLHGDEHCGPGHGHAAELGIAAARLACLRSRRATAAAAGAASLAQDLTCQIGDIAAMHRSLAAAIARGGRAPANLAASPPASTSSRSSRGHCRRRVGGTARPGSSGRAAREHS